MFTLLLALVAAASCALNAELLQSQFPESRVPGDRLVCQLFTDAASAGAVLFAADDFVVPASAFNATRRYIALQVTLCLVRSRRDADPDSLSLQLMRDDRGAPGQALFVRALTDIAWNATPLDTPFNLTLRLNYGDANQLSGRASLFDPMSNASLPRDTRLWLGVYATGPRNFAFASGVTFAENCLYWAVTGVNASATMRLNVTNGTAPRPYYFVDATDSLRENFVRWTRADVVERALGMSVGHYNMAWSVALLSNDTDPVPTPAPSWDDENVSWPPIDNYTGAPTPYNTTIVVWGVNVTLRNVLLAILLPLSALACVCASAWVLVQQLRRRRAKKENRIELTRLDSAYRNEKASGEYEPVQQQAPVEFSSFIDLSSDDARPVEEPLRVSIHED